MSNKQRSRTKHKVFRKLRKLGLPASQIVRRSDFPNIRISDSLSIPSIPKKIIILKS